MRGMFIAAVEPIYGPSPHGRTGPFAHLLGWFLGWLVGDVGMVGVAWVGAALVRVVLIEGGKRGLGISSGVAFV